jgi:hypothetical protein
MHPNREEEQNIGAPGTSEIGRGSTGNYIKCYSTRERLD